MVASNAQLSTNVLESSNDLTRRGRYCAKSCAKNPPNEVPYRCTCNVTISQVSSLFVLVYNIYKVGTRLLRMHLSVKDKTPRPLLKSLQPKPLSSQLVRFIHGAPPGHPEISQRMRPTPGVSRSEVHLLQSPCSPVFTQTTSINDKLACNGHFYVLKNGSVCKLCAPVLLSIIYSNGESNVH